MGLRRVLAGLMLLLVGVAPSARASAAVDTLLLRSSTPSELRASLLVFATSAPDSAKSDKGAALLYAGMSYDHAGKLDSALACYERAVAVRGSNEDRDAYVDALLERGHAGDPTRALEVLGPRIQVALTTSERDLAQTRGRQGWAYYIMNRSDSALTILRSQQVRLLDPATPRNRDWRYRIALVELEHGDAARSVDTMYPLALESRFQDRDVMSILHEASQKTPQGPSLGMLLKKELARIDADDQKGLAGIHGRRIAFTVPDGFTVAAIVVPSSRKTARAAVVITDPEELAEAYDSLAAGLAAAGYSVAIMESRGSGWSVGPACPLPSTWRGREDEMRTLVANDAIVALRALARATPVDTTRYLVIGALNSCAIAAEVASLDRRARPILMLAPSPSPVEQGPMRAQLAAAHAAVFFEVPVMDHATGPIAEALYEGLDPRTSRIAESDIVGSAATIFRYDKSSLPRLLLWLNESWASKSTASAKGTGRKR